MSSDYLWDRRGPHDPAVGRLERLLAPLGQQNPPERFRLPGGSKKHGPPFFITLAATAAAVIALVGIAWMHRDDVTPGWQVTRIAGAPTVGSRAVDDRAVLRVGTSLATDAASRAAITIAQVGQIEVEPHSRLTLLSARAGDYRLQLRRGTLHALIWSPPGQFSVETASSTAVDLGCAYTMTMDDDGAGLVRLTSGWVGFEWHGVESLIPAGAVCVTRPRLGPGTPHYEDTSEAFQRALETIDLRNASGREQSAALDRVLAEARPRDTVTLWHLLSRVDGADRRGRVFDRLAGIVPPPAGVTRDGVIDGRREMLDAWWDRLGFGATSWWRIWKQHWSDPTR